MTDEVTSIRVRKKIKDKLAELKRTLGARSIDDVLARLLREYTEDYAREELVAVFRARVYPLLQKAGLSDWQEVFAFILAKALRGEVDPAYYSDVLTRAEQELLKPSKGKEEEVAPATSPEEEGVVEEEKGVVVEEEEGIVEEEEEGIVKEEEEEEEEEEMELPSRKASREELFDKLWELRAGELIKVVEALDTGEMTDYERALLEHFCQMLDCTPEELRMLVAMRLTESE